MAKFTKFKTALAKGPTAAVGSAFTGNGGAGSAVDDKTALYSLAVTDMVAETTFYESAGGRNDRLVQLVHAVVRSDPAWVAELVTWLRSTAQMRSASAVIAAEYVRAGGANGRAVIGSACQRADEPAEVLAYWLSRYGKPIPMALKRGVADAATRLYTEQSFLKWDSARNALRMADVIDLVHPKPTDTKQSELFHHILDKRHKRKDAHLGERLTDLSDAYAFDGVPSEFRRAHLTGQGLPSLYTWERLSGWLPGGMDAQAWERAIPNMSYMALLRNLRNFEQAGVSNAVLAEVASIIANPAQVVKSRQLPYRFWAAYKSSGTVRFAPAIETALQASTCNVPALSGRTLVAVDTSGSMQSPVSSRSDVLCVEVGAVFAAALASKSDVDLMIYADEGKSVKQAPSVLRSVETITSLVGTVGHGTETWPSVLDGYDNHDRVIVFTDMQDNPAAQKKLPNVPVYVWDLRGYGVANIDPGRGRYLLSGFNDASFGLVNLLERGRNVGWPWEA